MSAVFRSLSLTAVLALTVTAANGDSSQIRELSAYCISADGLRTGVDASQDGATLAYVEALDGTWTMVRTVHSRRKVSLWHVALDAAGFDAMEMPGSAGPHCAIERLRYGKTHAVSWPEGETPSALLDVFGAIMELHGDDTV